MTILVHSGTELEGALGRFSSHRMIRLILGAGTDLDGLTEALSKFQLSQKPFQLILCGETNDPEGRFSVPTDCPSWSQLMVAIGSLRGISELIFKRLEMPLHLLTLLLQQRPVHLRSLELISVKLKMASEADRPTIPPTSAVKLKVGGITAEDDSPPEDVVHLMDSISVLPRLHRISCRVTRPGDWPAHANRPVAQALVRMEKPDCTVSWGLAVERPYPPSWTMSSRRVPPTGGIQLYLRDVDLATTALRRNGNLTVLTLCMEGNSGAAQFPALVAALTHNTTLETLELRSYHPPGAATTTQIWSEPIVAALPRLSLRKLVLRVHLAPTERRILLADLERALETNYSLHWLEIYDLPERGRRVRSLQHDFLLRLNRPKCGRACRRDLLAPSWGAAMSRERWVEQFVVLGEQGDLEALFYYLSNYTYWETAIPVPEEEKPPEMISVG